MPAPKADTTETEVVDRRVSPVGPVASEEDTQDNPWIIFFDAMRAAPRDEHWREFAQVMRERPMNQLPVERHDFSGAFNDAEVA